jgi:ribosomal protein L11 methyltransferase
VKWVELSLQVSPEAVDAVAGVFHDHGTGGVAIDQSVSCDSKGERAPEFLGLPVVKAFLPLTPGVAYRERQIEESLWHLRAFDLASFGPLLRREVDEEDWANLWKEHFHPLQFGRIVIKPSWRTWEAEPGQLIVELDPGGAFGTGLHPTTSMVLQSMQDKVSPGMEVLDLGTGSGILAIPAAMLGGNVVALDISETAVEVASQNFTANGLADKIMVELGSIEVVQGRQFQLILANIIAGVLIELAPKLREALAPNGEILASGIIDERADEVREAFRQAGLELCEEYCEGDWWLLVARRPK